MNAFLQKIKFWRAAIIYEISLWQAHKLRDGLADIFQAEQGRWFLFLPVFLGAGIAFYFALPVEPSLSSAFFLLIASALIFIALGYSCGFDHISIPFAIAVMMFSAGFTLAKMRSLSVSAPVIAGTLEDSILEGRIAAISPGPDKKSIRWIIEPTHISGMALDQMPRRIRMKIHPFDGRKNFKAGDRIQARALIFPPPGPVMPGGYDFARALWFERIGGTAVALDPPQKISRAVAQDGWASSMIAWLDNQRNAVAERIIDSTKEAGSDGSSGIAAALIVGQRGFIPERIRKKLHDIGLAHILAISGLHMAALAGAIYFMVRACFAFFPSMTLKYPIKKWAIIPALIGAQVITMRNVALAALIILALAPESLFHAGFQLSFAATIAIVAVYEIVSFHRFRRRAFDGAGVFLVRKGFHSVLALALTSLAAWAATSPLTIVHFHRIAFLSALAANLLVLPLFTIWIMPTIAAAMVLMPFGLESSALIFLTWGLEIILAIVNWITRHFAAVYLIASPAPLVFIFYIAGGLWLCFWQTRWRWLGAVPLVFSVIQAFFIEPDKFDLLVAREGNLIALRDHDGRLYPSSRAGHWTLAQWLRADGDRRTAWQAYDPRKFSCTKAGCRSTMQGRPQILLLRNPDHAQARALCENIDIVIFAKPAPESLCASVRQRISHQDILRGGAHGGFFRKEQRLFEIHTASEQRGQRVWTGKKLPGKKLTAP